jgi:hypothetical protein
MKLFILVSMAILSGCATVNKCGKAKELENAVYDSASCQVYIRQGIYLDQVSADMVEKIKQGNNVSLKWVPAKSSGSNFIPAHVEFTPEKVGGEK